MKNAFLIFSLALSVGAQTNLVTSGTASNSLTGNVLTAGQRAENIRADCVQNRRIICGKILKVLPDGLVVDSGYTDLLRPALNASWLVPGSVVASRPPNIIEKREPEAVCIGVVFLTDIPKLRGAAARPKLYDYVILLGYPCGQYTYTSAGTIQKTVRQFSVNISSAVKLNFEAAEKSGAALPPK